MLSAAAGLFATLIIHSFTGAALAAEPSFDCRTAKTAREGGNLYRRAAGRC